MKIILKLFYVFLQNIKKKRDGLYNLVWFKIRHVQRGKNIKIHGKIKIFGHGTIVIADNVTINSHINYNPIGGHSGCIFSTTDTSSIILKEGAGISNVSICAWKSVTIGKNVFIGGDCRIYDTDFHSLKLNERLQIPDRHVHVAPVIIKDGAFIGASSIILKGVTIGENSIIGAGSVVTKNIPANQIWAGNPVRFIRNVEE